MSEVKWKCPIAVCTYNRPDYFKRCMEFLSATPEIGWGEVPVYIFCDGGTNSMQKDISLIVKEWPFITEAKFHDTRVGLPCNIHFAQKKIFDELNADRLMFLEDDILVSPYYYRVMNCAMDYFEQVDPSVVMVNSSGVCKETFAQKANLRLYFGEGYSHLNNYIMTRKAWKAIKPLKEEYIRLFIDTVSSYQNRDHGAIMEWATKKIDQAGPQPGLDIVKSRLISSQDCITNLAMRLVGLKYMSSYVNRIKNIGRIGEHFDAEHFARSGFEETELDIIPRDEVITTQFRLVEK